MLTRPCPFAPLAPTPRRCSRRRGAPSPSPVLPVSPPLRRWLSAGGSLTARLRQLGTVRVEVLAQGRRLLWPQEHQALGCRAGHVREVVLRIDERPAVWARSCVPVGAVKGPWRAIRGLGTRPLAELLFAHRAVRRGPLQTAHWRTHGAASSHMSRQWSRVASGPDARHKPHWARHSLFHHHGQPLQVLEAFAPWLSKLSCRQG